MSDATPVHSPTAGSLFDTTDERLAAELKKGPGKTPARYPAGELLGRHWVPVFSYARLCTNDAQHAGMLATAAFTRLFGESVRQVGPRAAWRPELLVTVRRIAGEWDADKRRGMLSPRLRSAQGGGGSAADRLLPPTDRRLVSLAFQRLPEAARCLLWHAEVEAEEPAVPARLLGLSVPDASRALERARELLRQYCLEAHRELAPDDECRRYSRLLDVSLRRGGNSVDPDLRQHMTACGHCPYSAEQLDQSGDRLPVLLAEGVLGWAAHPYLASRPGRRPGGEETTAGPVVSTTPGTGPDAGRHPGVDFFATGGPYPGADEATSDAGPDGGGAAASKPGEAAAESAGAGAGSGHGHGSVSGFGHGPGFGHGHSPVSGSGPGHDLGSGTGQGRGSFPARGQEVGSYRGPGPQAGAGRGPGGEPGPAPGSTPGRVSASGPGLGRGLGPRPGVGSYRGPGPQAGTGRGPGGEPGSASGEGSAAGLGGGPGLSPGAGPYRGSGPQAGTGRGPGGERGSASGQGAAVGLGRGPGLSPGSFPGPGQGQGRGPGLNPGAGPYRGSGPQAGAGRGPGGELGSPSGPSSSPGSSPDLGQDQGRGPGPRPQTGPYRGSGPRAGAGRGLGGEARSTPGVDAGVGLGGGSQGGSGAEGRAGAEGGSGLVDGLDVDPDDVWGASPRQGGGGRAAGTRAVPGFGGVYSGVGAGRGRRLGPRHALRLSSRAGEGVPRRRRDLALAVLVVSGCVLVPLVLWWAGDGDEPARSPGAGTTAEEPVDVPTRIGAGDTGPGALGGRLRNQGSGDCAGVADGKVGVGAEVVLATCTASERQQWSYESDGLLRSLADRDLCLDSRLPSPVRLGPCEGEKDRAGVRYDFTADGNLVPLGQPALALAPGSGEEETGLVLRARGGGPAQRWEIDTSVDSVQMEWITSYTDGETAKPAPAPTVDPRPSHTASPAPEPKPTPSEATPAPRPTTSASGWTCYGYSCWYDDGSGGHGGGGGYGGGYGGGGYGGGYGGGH
ncbi:ricin-type beta-trefoil lectin domain protein [Streptomyces sp. NPDC060205]|uniref:ricin-type beta-trefoil lectin domain protein n=1 Tax=Streptomyces sp. NPDC060205 TaxID=3347072 RepID=UPI0036657625